MVPSGVHSLLFLPLLPHPSSPKELLTQNYMPATVVRAGEPYKMDLCLPQGFLCFVSNFIYFWLRWVFVAARGLSLVGASGGYSSLQCVGFSLRWLLLLQSMSSRCVGFSSCGMWAQ